MEPNKFEQDIRQKMEQRTVQPTEMAWDRLDAMLSVTENKKPKKNRAWMYMAAALLVFLLVGILFLNQEIQNGDVENNNNGVVTTEKENNETVLKPNAQVTTEEAVVMQPNPSTVTVKKGNSTIQKIQQNNKVNNVVADNESVASKDTKEANNIVPVNTNENLLASATNEMPKKKPSITVDPNSLLSSVEGELNESYRSRAFQGVVKSFNTVKVAVANRNYE